jgi:alanyl-tRNA synthetase
VAGEAALAHIHQLGEQLDEAAAIVKADALSVVSKIRQMQERSRLLEREIETLKAKLAAQAGNDLLSQIVQINGQQVLWHNWMAWMRNRYVPHWMI